ncbi:GTP-binding protein [Vannielia sp.]|uniref:ArgK/MeaB family GTPase n=1 Tax=Vannielia sp. TaxID=2813045 RepID=UPI002616E02D|nr:GTP-binding protein [Vannielia sp.]MDF1871385.1 GTP-binding protein [Vannielia sp.]
MSTDTPLNRRQISRELTRIANASVRDVLDTIGHSEAPAAFRIGITGPPGGGKSTLINALVKDRLKNRSDTRLAVLAIDPSSPVSGGAILGDRIRMDAIADLPGLYLRSLSSRGARNGLCDNIVDLLTLLETHGFDEVVLETVGVGQSEVAVHEVVDTLVVIVPPDAGDSVQTMKSGILEMADIVVVTKADQPGARRMASDLAAVLRKRGDRDVPVLQTEAEGAGVAALNQAINDHRAWLAANHPHALTRENRRRYHLQALIERQVQDALKAKGDITRGTLTASYDRLLAALRVK